MPRTERRRLVEKEQLGPPARSHDLPMPSPELETARDPTPNLRMTHDSPRIVVQNASVTEDEPASFKRHDLTERCNPILQRHEPAWLPLRVSSL
jgi:hypothetical protein